VNSSINVSLVAVTFACLLLASEAVLFRNLNYTNTLEDWPNVNCTVTDKELKDYDDNESHAIQRELYTVSYEVEGVQYNSTTYYTTQDYEVGTQLDCVYNPDSMLEVYFLDFLTSMQSDYIRALLIYPLYILVIIVLMILCTIPCFIYFADNKAVDFRIPQHETNIQDYSRFYSKVPQEVISLVSRYLSMFAGDQEILSCAPVITGYYRVAIMLVWLGVMCWVVGILSAFVILSYWSDVFLNARLFLFTSMLLGPAYQLITWYSLGLIFFGWKMKAPYLFINSQQGVLVYPNRGSLFGGPKYSTASFLWDQGKFHTKPHQGSYKMYYGESFICSGTRNDAAALKAYIERYITPTNSMDDPCV
jgi:hypothetical protein